MVKGLSVACACYLATAAAWADPALTDTETRWLQLAWPAVSYARALGLPLDIVVQPQPTPGHAPLAMAYVEGRCKLVLSMRGNPAAQATLDEIPASLQPPLLEAMAAHELGHCWRYVRGAWHTVPAGFAAARGANDEDPQLAEMQRTRREEGFADLVGLAWTAEHHPQRYAEVHAWLMAFRDEPELPGTHHDTVAWLRLAPTPAAFAATPASLFEQAWPLWQRGLAP